MSNIQKITVAVLASIALASNALAGSGQIKSCNKNLSKCQINLLVSNSDVASLASQMPSLKFSQMVGQEERSIFSLKSYRIFKVEKLSNDLRQITIGGSISWRVKNIKHRNKLINAKHTYAVYGISSNSKEAGQVSKERQEQMIQSSSNNIAANPNTSSPEARTVGGTTVILAGGGGGYWGGESSGNSSISTRAGANGVHGMQKSTMVSDGQMQSYESTHEVNTVSNTSFGAKGRPVANAAMNFHLGTPTSQTSTVGFMLIFKPMNTIEYGFGSGLYRSSPFMSRSEGQISYNTTNLHLGYNYGRSFLRLNLGLDATRFDARFVAGRSVHLDNQRVKETKHYDTLIPSFGLRYFGEIMVFGFSIGRSVSLGSSIYKDLGAPFVKVNQLNDSYRNPRSTLSLYTGFAFE